MELTFYYFFIDEKFSGIFGVVTSSYLRNSLVVCPSPPLTTFSGYKIQEAAKWSVSFILRREFVKEYDTIYPRFFHL